MQNVKEFVRSLKGEFSVISVMLQMVQKTVFCPSVNKPQVCGENVMINSKQKVFQEKKIAEFKKKTL